MSDTPAPTSFLWVPAQGPDCVAFERMAREFAKPRKPMGEAWFMAPEREMYPELLGDLEVLTDEQLERPIEEMAMEEGSFGVGWEWSHTLSGNYSGDHEAPVQMIPFLPPENKAAILDIARTMDTDEFFEELLTDPQLEAVAAETVGLPERFAQLYRGTPIG